MMMTDILKTIAGGQPDEDNVQSVVVSLTGHGTTMGLHRPHRVAHFLAQLMHESARFKYDQEIWGPTPAQRRYEDRADLGHSSAVPGEAFKFKGRSGIQLTGRYNYQQFTKWCRDKVDPDAPDFEVYPDLINTDPWEGLAPMWYWDEGSPTGASLNVYADDNNIEAVTRKINGGLNGFTDRLELYVRSSLVLLGYKMDVGVVRRFQVAAGFTGRDVDDIPGQKTRTALHGQLLELPAFDWSTAKPELDIGAEVGDIRRVLAEVGQRVDLLENRLGA